MSSPSKNPPKKVESIARALKKNLSSINAISEQKAEKLIHEAGKMGK